MSRSQVGLENLFGTKRERNNDSGTYSVQGGIRTESTNYSMKNSRVQAVEGVVPWKILEHNKSVVLYTKYNALISKAKYKIGFYVIPLQFFEKDCNVMGGLEREKHHGNGLVCDVCFNIRLRYGQNIIQIVRDRAVTFESAL